MLAAFVLTSAALAQTPGLVAVGGLLQRLAITIGLSWITAVTLRALATTSPSLSEAASHRHT